MMHVINSDYNLLPQSPRGQIASPNPALDQTSYKVASAAATALGLIFVGAVAGAMIGSVVPIKGTIIGAGVGALIGLICALIRIVKLVSEHLQLGRLKAEVDQFINDKASITLPGALEIMSKIDLFEAKYKDRSDYEITKVLNSQRNSLLNSVQEQAHDEFHRLNSKVVDFSIEEGNATNIEKGTSLISEITQFEEKFGNRTADGKLTGQIFARARKQYTIEKKDLANLKNKVLFVMKPDVPSFDLITTAIAIDDTPLTVEESWYCQQFAKKFPNLSAAKAKYRSLQNHKLEVFDTIVKVPFDETEIDCRRFNANERFFVHTTSSEAILNRMMGQQLDGTICASLINGTTSYFHPESNIAIMLAVDPACIATTAKEDVQSPMLNPAKSSEHQQTAKKYYNFHRKFQVVATYIDLIFKNFYGSEATDDFTLYHRLLAQEETVGIRIQEREKSCADLSLENPQHLKFNEQLTALRELQQRLQAQIAALRAAHQNDPIFQSKNQWKLEGVTSVQLRTLIDDFKLHPANDTPEMFQIIFGRPGAGVLAELEKCYQFVQDTLAQGDVLSRMNVSRFLDPDELLAQTHSSLDNGYFDYNEVGLDLRSEMGFKPDMLKVKGILIDRQLILNNNLSAAEKTNLTQLINTAKQHGLPIFYRD